MVNKGSNFCGFGDAYSDALIDEANKTLDYETHRNALLKLQAKIYEDQPYVFLWITKRKFAVHKRFDNRDMYFEFPGLRLNNLKLNSDYTASGLTEDIYLNYFTKNTAFYSYANSYFSIIICNKY